MALVRSGGSHHYIKRIYPDIYEIGWAYEAKYTGARTRHHRWIRRDTNEKGARRFAKKWGLEMPTPPAKSAK